jgi:hypothetical protein
LYEYTVVEYGGQRAQLIMGWRKAIMGPAPAASIDEASIDEAGPVEYLVKWRNESYHHCSGCRAISVYEIYLMHILYSIR